MKVDAGNADHLKMSGRRQASRPRPSLAPSAHAPLTDARCDRSAMVRPLSHHCARRSHRLTQQCWQRSPQTGGER